MPEVHVGREIDLGRLEVQVFAHVSVSACPTSREPFGAVVELILVDRCYDTIGTASLSNRIELVRQPILLNIKQFSRPDIKEPGFEEQRITGRESG